MNIKENIKACPFCGNLEVDICRTNKEACWIECCNCGAGTNGAPLRKDAIALWNMRSRIKKFARVLDDDDKRFYSRNGNP